jgi:hypothetical protein
MRRRLSKSELKSSRNLSIKKNRKCIELAKITATVDSRDSHGGLCTSEAHIDHLIQQCQNITAKKTALRNHIMYYKLVSKTIGCEKQWFLPVVEWQTLLH